MTAIPIVDVGMVHPGRAVLTEPVFDSLRAHGRHQVLFGFNHGSHLAIRRPGPVRKRPTGVGTPSDSSSSQGQEVSGAFGP